jgi:hypothetical protein
MILTATTDKLSLITEQAGDVDVIVNYVDRVTSTGAVGAANRQVTTITTATTTDILASPAADTTRKVLDISIRNAHATTSVDVVVQYNANGTLYEAHAARLYPTERLAWSFDSGFNLNTRPKRVREFIVSDSVAVSEDSSTHATLPGAIFLHPTKAANTERKVGVLASFPRSQVSTSATQPGVKLSQHSSPVAVFSGIMSSTLGAVDSQLASGTRSAMSGSCLPFTTNLGTPALAFLAGGLIYTEVPRVPVILSVIVTTPTNDSQGGCEEGTLFEVFEATEL